MKKLKAFLIVACLCAGSAYGQKAKVQTAYNFYKEPYQQYDKAKQAIDEAILHEQTASMAKTWYYRGLIYQALYKNQKYGDLCDNCLMTAYEAYERAIQIDPENEWITDIKEIRMRNLANNFIIIGNDAFQIKDYNTALSNFEIVYKIAPEDTTVLLYCAYSAEGAANYEKAKKYYKQLIDMHYKDDNMYNRLSLLYLTVDNDPEKALSVIRDGRKLYPDSMSLLTTEIQLLLNTKRNSEATDLLVLATQRDPNNANLFTVLGSTYSTLANPVDAEGKPLPQPADYAELMQKSEEAYKKGLALNPENYLLNYNIGTFYFNKGAEIKNRANKLESNSAYEKEKEKFDKLFHEAEPYFQKALDNNPKKTEEDHQTYADTLNSLKALYAQTGETEKYNKVKALQQSGE